ncbi:MAG: hypothetical protein ACRDIX_07340 [Actinomycetota bacterium]
MAAIANGRTGQAFWARILELDYIRHGRRRSVAAMSREWGVAEPTLGRWIAQGFVPAVDVAVRIARAVGMAEEMLFELFAAPVSSTRGNTATARELSSSNARPEARRVAA